MVHLCPTHTEAMVQYTVSVQWWGMIFYTHIQHSVPCQDVRCGRYHFLLQQLFTIPAGKMSVICVFNPKLFNTTQYIPKCIMIVIGLVFQGYKNIIFKENHKYPKINYFVLYILINNLSNNATVLDITISIAWCNNL